jgi:NtrC-family two-component system sensor histidine kinase KinB
MHNLQTRFILAGCLLVLTTVGSSVWSALTFARLSSGVGEALRVSQDKIDLAALLASSLEREDDALVLALSGDLKKARRDLDRERQRGDTSLKELLRLLGAENGKDLELEIKSYRHAGDSLVVAPRQPDDLNRYHTEVNPLLRRAVASCAAIREENFRTTQLAGVRARDEASRATWVVAGVSLGAVVLASVVAVWLARSVVRPIAELTASVDALRQGDFERRVSSPARGELGQLAAGFNRMAETLGDYRRSSLGELLTAKMTLEATLNALPDAVLVVDPDGAVVALNPPARAILEAVRIPREKNQAEISFSLADLPIRPQHREAIKAALAGRPAIANRTNFEQAIQIQLNGRPRKLLLSAVPIPEFAPHRFGAVFVLDDMTDLARLDELRAELIGVASHELKTPLTTLRMNLLLLSEQADNLTRRQREMLAAAGHGCEELEGTIDELLDVTRIEAGQLRLNLEPVDFRAVLVSVVRAQQGRYDDAQVVLRIEGGHEPALIRGDGPRLAIVLSNLLSNALKYSLPGGTVTVRLSSEQDTATNRRAIVQITVTDQGPGIPEEFRERVFEKFFRVEHHVSGAADGVRGTGIGLYLCREIVRTHGGTIQCESGDGGRGTTVRCAFPGLAF